MVSSRPYRGAQVTLAAALPPANNRLISVAVAHLLGLVLLIALAVVTRETIPPTTDFVWGALAGLSGIVGLGGLYQCLGLRTYGD